MSLQKAFDYVVLCIPDRFKKSIEIKLEESKTADTYFITIEAAPNLWHNESIKKSILKIKSNSKSNYISFPISYATLFIENCIDYIANLSDRTLRVTIENFLCIDKKLLEKVLEKLIVSSINFKTFGCCSRFKECEKAKVCLHPDQLYSTACQYQNIITKNTSTDRTKTTLIKNNSILKQDMLETYVVIDTETTGFNANFCEIIEVGALKVENGKIIDSFTSLINPHQEISKTIKNITHIQQEELDAAPDKETVFPQFLEFIGTNTIVGHNISFDIRFINKTAQDLKLEQLTNDVVDTLNLSRRILPGLKSHKLQELISHFGITPIAKHRALADCDSTNQLLNCLYNIDNFDLNDFVSNSNKKIDLSKINPDNPFKGKKVAFKGTIKGCDNETLEQVCAACGFRYNTAFFSYINVLVLGEYTYNKYKSGNLSRYMEDAKEREDNGKLLVISETEFFKQIY